MSTKQNKYSKNSLFMKLALTQAKMNVGNTNENPSVGCILVKNDKIISSSSTSIGGRPHAEANAIKLSKVNVKNSDLYVTLEPCSHYGKTPPCTKLIIKNKINKVFYGINDPNSGSGNKCNKILRKKNIKVTSGIHKKKINTFYRSYIKSRKSYLPFVTCKLAVSNDYYASSKKEGWITNFFSRGRVHMMRSEHDCIITSSQTVNKDNSKLDCRIEGLEHTSPTRILLDNKLKISLNTNFIKSANKKNTIIFYNKKDKKKINLLKKHKIKLIKIPLDINNDLNLIQLLIKVKEMGFYRVFLESGIKLISNFLDNNLIDDFNLFISDKKLGLNGYNSFKNYSRIFLNGKKIIKSKINLNGDKLILYKLQ